MKLLIVFACALAAASASNLLGQVASYYPEGQHLPVIGANGVPVDTPAVQQATAEHLVHKVEAHVRNGDYVGPVLAQTPAVAAAAYPTTAGVPAVSASGVPLDTPEVAAAKINHFAAHSEALARTEYPVVPYSYPYSTLYRARRGVVAFNAYAHTPIVSAAYSTYPHSSTVVYRARRGVVAPVAYTGYAHAPVVATSAYTYPYAHDAAVLYRKRRGVVAPVVTSYAHTPVVASSVYSTFPYAHYY